MAGRSRAALLALVFALVVGLAAASGDALAQTIQGPQETRPELPPYEAPSDQPPLALPDVELPQAAERERLSSGLRIFVSGWRVVGSSVFSDAELATALAPWTGREIGSEELLAARDAVTRLYVEKGYLSSGATLPDQDPENGVIELRIVEGRLGEVSVTGSRWLRDGWVEARARRGARQPLNVVELEQALELLQQAPQIRRIDARLAPGPRPDESVLDLRVEEAFPFQLGFRVANDIATSIGGERAEATLADIDLTGNADTLRATYSQGQGLSEWDASYDIPFTKWDTRLALAWNQSRSKVVEEPFSDLDVRSDRSSYSVTLSQPLFETPASSLELGSTFELQQSRLRILGEDFGFTEGIDNGRTKETIVRAFVSFFERSREQVLALRVSGNIGLDAFDSTISDDSSIPDSRFTFLLAQAQYARRLPESWRSSQLIARLDLQLAQDPLLPLDQLSIGGMATVRGYHVNQIVRDSGAIASLELRVPILRDANGRDRLQLAPFADWGKGWNDRDTFGMRWLASVGLGLRYQLADRANFAVYWGSPLRHIDDQNGGGLQNSGISVEMSLIAF
jgi:hemolysin activation/secretion protein